MLVIKKVLKWGIKRLLAFEYTHSYLLPLLQEILGVYEILRKEFPDAKLHASTFEKYFEALNKIRNKLPVFDKEVGDTWMQGVGTDPKKTAQYRALYRVMSDCINSGNFPGYPFVMMQRIITTTYVSATGRERLIRSST